MNEIWEKILSGAFFLGLVSWIWIRSQRATDALEVRMQALEQNHMSRDEHLRILAEMSQTRKDMHAENQSQLAEIRRQIEENESKRSTTEHKILDIVNELKLKNAAIEAVEQFKRLQDQR